MKINRFPLAGLLRRISKNPLGRSLWAAGLLVGMAGGARAAETGSITVQVDRPGAAISPTFYGLMTEEINHSYDGGLYAELIQNRAFKDNPTAPAHWTLVPGTGSGTMALDRDQPVPDSALDVALRLDVTKSGGPAGVGVANDGYWGIPVRPNTPYRVSLWARAGADFKGGLRVALQSRDGGSTFAEANLGRLAAQWKKYEVTLRTGASAPESLDNRFLVAATGTGSVWITQVSVFPPTFKDRANGNRIDLMEKMLAMKPTFLRLPGGNYLDPGHYEWKKTIGPVDQRAGHPGAWSYRSSDGLGLLEFLQWCEELNVEPVLGVTDGRGWLPGDGDVTPLVQDALDEIEYVSGDPTTKWGARRAADGHPAPFKLRFVEIGNEDFFDPHPVYEARFAQFFRAIKAKYPQLQIIATRGDLKETRPDIVDDHYYRSADAMSADAGHYDNVDRNGPKIFVGEWATTEGSPTPTLQAALGDAAWLTGLERNSDLVVMQCYAPLLVNVNPGARQWGTNLIGYDALHSFGSPSYYLQVMFAENTGDVVLPTEVRQPEIENAPQGGIGVGTWMTQAEFKDIVVKQDGGTLFPDSAKPGLNAWKLGRGQWTDQAGVLTQAGDGEQCLATVAADWKNYTLTLKARKTGGDEGFLIPFHVRDSAHLLWWNVGGWGNQRSAIEKISGGSKSQVGDSTPLHIETDRWYDVKIVLQGAKIQCYLDGKLVNEGTDAGPMAIYAAASGDRRTGEVLLKVVNRSESAQPLQIDLQGSKAIAPKVVGEQMSGEPGDVNTIAEPTRIIPEKIQFTVPGNPFTREFPAHSVTVLRFKPRTP
jgi:alpha-L-arabinofuranosidase